MIGKMVSLMCLVLLQGRKRKRERERRQGGQGGHLAQHVAKIGADCDDSEVGQRSTKFSLREALDSLQDDIELSSLAGTDGNTCGLNKTKKREQRFR